MPFGIEELVTLSPQILIFSVIWMGILKKYADFTVWMAIVGGFAMGIATPWLLQTIF